MNWIKKRYDQFILVLAAVALIGVAALLFLWMKGFPEKFAAAHAQVVPSEKIPELDLTIVKNTEAQVAKPAKWEVPKGVNEYVFAADIYWIGEKGVPEKPTEGSKYPDSLSNKGIPNRFFIVNGISLLDQAAPKLDPDKDGFTNEDEWRGSRDGADPNKWLIDSTDPNDPKSHPPLVTKLFLKQWIRVRFRLLFQAYDGDATKPNEMTFQINAVDRGRKTEFLKIGQKVANSPFRLEKFERKMEINKKTGSEEDVSELTVLNTETNDAVILIQGKETDSPDSFGLFDYQLTGKDIQVKKLQEFILLPDKEKRYKLIDIKEGQALIQLPDGTETYVVVPDPRAKK